MSHSPIEPNETPVTSSETEATAPVERDAPQALGADAIAAFAEQTPTAGPKKPRKKGKKRLLMWVSIFVVVAILAGGALALPRLLAEDEDEPDEPERPDTSVTLIDKELGSDGKKIENPIKQIHVTSHLDDFTLKLNDDGVLKLTEAEDLAVNKTNVEALVEQLVRVKAQDTIAKGLTDFADYGLDDPTATVEVTYADDVTVTLRLASLAVGNHYYLRLDEQDTVYLLDSSLANEVLQTAERFVGLTVVAPPSIGSNDANGKVVLKELSLTGSVRGDQITSLRLMDEKEAAEYEHSTYLLTEPYFSDTDATVVSEVTAVTMISASEVVALHPTEAQLKEYGLDDPRSVAKIVLAVATSTTDEEGKITASGTYNETTHLVQLGKKTEDGAYYAMADTMDVVFLVEAASVPWAERTYHDFANQYLFLRYLNTLSGISCTFEGKTYDFAFQHFPDEKELDDQLKVTVGGKEYPSDEFRELYKVLMTLLRTGPAPAEPSGDPLLTVVITPTNKDFATKTVRIYPYSGSVYIAQTQSGDTYKMTASRVDDAIAQIKNYVNGEHVVNRY